jgi:endonuclease/exonuclease/phosphatase family metal-dependent hydrolase
MGNDIKKRNKKAIGVFYGPQENVALEERQRQYSVLCTQIHQIKQEATVVLTGDFNAKIKIDKDTIQQEQSSNGKIMEEIMEETQMMAISTRASSGNWTRVNRKNQNEKSIIDYITYITRTKQLLKPL